MWRAADDTSDLNYIEVLLELLVAHPGRDLAAPRVVSVLPDGRVAAAYDVPRPIENAEAIGRAAQLFLVNAGWIYGLFRREPMIRLLPEILEDYPHYSGWDVVTLIPFAFDRKVIGANRTSWYGDLRYPGPRPNNSQRAARDVARSRNQARFPNTRTGMWTALSKAGLSDLLITWSYLTTE